MKIKTLEFSGFKNVNQHSNVKFDFFNHTRIIGENFSGKTTICEAICWLFWGCNINGHIVYEKLLLNSDSQTMYAQADFIDNSNKPHTLRRERASSTIITMDGKQIEQNDLMSYVGDKDIFMSSFVLGHFEKYSPREARDLFMKVLPEIPYETICKGLPDKYSNLLTQKIASKSNTTLKESRARIKEIEKEQIYLNGQLKILSENIHGTDDKPQIDLTILIQKIDETEKKIMELVIQKTTSRTDSLEAEKQLLRKQYNLLKERFADNSLNAGDTCPKCLQLISDDAALALRTSGVESNTAIQIEMKKIIERGNEINTEIEKLSSSKNNLEALDFCINSLKTELEEYKSKYQKSLELKAKDDISHKSKQSIQEINIRLLNLSEEQSELVLLSEAISAYNSVRSELQFKNLSSNLNKVSIRLEKLVKSTGELKECFEILYDNKDFMLLSNSEKIRTSLEISNLINNETNLQLPVFMDNAECITHYDKPNRQIFEAVVQRDSKLNIINLQ